MVAEAVAEVVGGTPPEDVANPTPEVTTEAAPEGENQQAEPSFIDDLLAGIDSESATTAADGTVTTADGKAPVTEAKPLTPDEAKEQGRRERDAEIASQQTAVQRQNYINGLNAVVQDVPKQLTALAQKYTMEPADVTEMLGQLNRYYGALKPLADHSVEQYRPQVEQETFQRTQANVAQLIYDTVQAELGDASYKALQEAGAKDWDSFVKAVGKEYRKGHVPAADYTSKKAVKALLDKLDVALKSHNLSLQAINGNGGQILPRATGGTGSQPKNYEEAEAWHASGRWDNAQMKQYRASHSRN